MDKSIVFACDTPLQVLNAINMKESHFKDYHCTIFICNQFETAEKISNKLIENTLFDEVFLIKKYKKYPSAIQKIITIVRMIFPYAVLRRYNDGDRKMVKRRYDYVAFSFITPFSITVFGSAGTNAFIQLEDGMGTYVGNILNDYTTGIFKRIAVHTRYRNIFSPHKVCVYNPSMYHGNNMNILKLENTFSEDLRKKIEFVYEYKKNSIYKNHKIIYLTQPFSETNGFDEEKLKKTDEIIRKYREEAVVRLHPRDKESSYDDFIKDTFNNLWELECIHQIRDENILIGAFSTTQLMPKILTNSEPYVIFLFKIIFDNANSEYWKKIEAFICEFSEFYVQNKIYIPRDVEEFGRIMDKIMKEEEFIGK